jgi:type IV secretion system protein TrbL
VWALAAVGGMMLFFAPELRAQIATNNPSRILQQYRNFRANWGANIWPYANTLFALLATIEFAWSAAVMALEKADLQSWTGALIRKIMWLGAFYALLLFGRQWIPAIIDSFAQLGGSAAGIDGTQGLSPSDVFRQGLNIAGALMDGASTSAFFTNPGPSIAVMIAAALVVLAFIAVTIQYIVAVVESYLVVAAGVIFLGFGGSRWTTPYVERYIGLGVATGVKIMILYMLIGAGLSLSGGWLDEALAIGKSPNPSMTGFDVMGASLIFMMLCWQVPKVFAAVLGGSPALSGGDLVATGTALAAGAAAVTALGVGAIGATVGSATSLSGAVGRGGGVNGAPAGISGLPGSAGGGTVPPPSSPPPAPGGGPRQPSPPTAGGSGASASPPEPARAGNDTNSQSTTARLALSSVGGDNLAGSGFESERPAAGFARGSTPAAAMDSVRGTRSDSSPPGVESDVKAVSAAEQSRPTAPSDNPGSGVGQRRRPFTGAAERLRGARRRWGRLPSDAAPHTPPPRMPIDHTD